MGQESNDSIEINMDIINSIDFSVNFSKESLIDKTVADSKFLGAESLPQYYIKEDDLCVTLSPYNGSTKYNEDPIMGKMMSDSFGKKYSTKISPDLFPSGSDKPKAVFTGFTFSMEDILQSIFSKSYRAKVHNAKHAKAWKYY